MDISGNQTAPLAIEIEDDVPLVINEDEPIKNYEVEDLLEMLGGDQYYSMDKIMYVFHTLRDEVDEAEYYKDIIEKKEIALNKKLFKMKNKNIG